MSLGPDLTLSLRKSVLLTAIGRGGGCCYGWNFFIPFPPQSPSWFPIALRENPGCVPVRMALLPLSMSQAGSTPCPCCSRHMALGSLHKTSRTSHLGALPHSSLCLEVSPGHQAEDSLPAQRPFSDNASPDNVFPCFLSPQHSHFCPL